MTSVILLLLLKAANKDISIYANLVPFNFRIENLIEVAYKAAMFYLYGNFFYTLIAFAGSTLLAIGAKYSLDYAIKFLGEFFISFRIYSLYRGFRLMYSESRKLYALLVGLFNTGKIYPEVLGCSSYYVLVHDVLQAFAVASLVAEITFVIILADLNYLTHMSERLLFLMDYFSSSSQVEPEVDGELFKKICKGLEKFDEKMLLEIEVEVPNTTQTESEGWVRTALCVYIVLSVAAFSLYSLR